MAPLDDTIGIDEDEGLLTVYAVARGKIPLGVVLGEERDGRVVGADDGTKLRLDVRELMRSSGVPVAWVESEDGQMSGGWTWHGRVLGFAEGLCDSLQALHHR